MGYIEIMKRVFCPLLVRVLSIIFRQTLPIKTFTISYCQLYLNLLLCLKHPNSWTHQCRKTSKFLNSSMPQNIPILELIYVAKHPIPCNSSMTQNIQILELLHDAKYSNSLTHLPQNIPFLSILQSSYLEIKKHVNRKRQYSPHSIQTCF